MYGNGLGTSNVSIHSNDFGDDDDVVNSISSSKIVGKTITGIEEVCTYEVNTV